jgi:23S rRNA (uracil1939-C5)-methyltransferase
MKDNTEIVTIEKLVHGGQGIGTLADGRRVFVWNALPGETVKVRLTKTKKSHAEGIAEEVIEVSPHRVSPKDAAYLSTSPWQIMDMEAENRFKGEILTETLQREHVDYADPITVISGKNGWHYRNKMEYSFWADDNGLHLALFNRGTHQKQIVEGSSIAMPTIDETGLKILEVLNKHGIRGSQLKTVVIRANQRGQAVVALFVKDESFPELPELESICRGVAVYFSNPKSPASVLTRELYVYGEIVLTDTIRGHEISYDVNSFFQVNVEVFEMTLDAIAREVSTAPAVDMYAGVGTIGIPIGAQKLVEIDQYNIDMAKHNVGSRNIEGVHASAESALEHIDHDMTLIVDPPRAGLHQKVTDRILEILPPKVIYLSCNPITQARDLALLQPAYEIKSIQGYNFFPKTPHIESLAVLIRKES